MIERQGACFAAFIANTWTTPVHVEAEYGDAPLDLVRSGRIVRTTESGVTYDPFDGDLQPEDVVVLFLEQRFDTVVPCPRGIEAARRVPSGIFGTGRGDSYRIKTSAPVSAYSIFPYGGGRSKTSSATLLLPIATWKTDYIVANAWERGAIGPGAPTTQIVAAEDDTEVTIVGSVRIQGGPAVESAEGGVPQTYRMRRGELLQFTQDQMLSGSLLSANKKVGLWGGHECLFIPADKLACDQSTRQLPPVQAWGHEYVAVPYLSRRPDKTPEVYFYRVMAAADGTTLTYEPSRPPDAPASLSKGDSALFTTNEPFIVNSQDESHPIAVYEYMSGSTYETSPDYDGDPEFSYVVPAAQYLDNYVFFVDPTYRNSQLVVVRSRRPGSDFEPVTLDCAGPLEDWTPIGTAGIYEYTRFYVSKDGIPRTVGNGKCGAGRHNMSSRGAFGVTVWGTDYATSYAYPGGAAIRPINNTQAIVH